MNRRPAGRGAPGPARSIVDRDRRALLGGGLAALGAALLPVRLARTLRTADTRARTGTSAAGTALPSANSTPAAAGGLDFSPGLEAARAVRSGDVSSVELTTRLLARIERLDGRLHAVVTIDRDGALARARAADEARARGESWGPFHGVPCTIKDTFETAGLKTTAGSREYSAHVPKRDAPAVARLRAAGVVVLGKTNVPPMASDWQTYNDLFGTTNNPWDTARTPGGSSGGEAAALAAGLTYLSLGSDLAGSIRVPAHFCGVYGHKPSLGIVPLAGHIPPAPGGPPEPPSDLAVAGPLARSAADLLAALQVLAGPDGDEAKAWRFALPPARGARLTDYRIGFLLDDPRCPVTAEVRGVLAAAIEALRRAGARLEEGWPPGVDPKGQYDTYRFLMNSTFASGLSDDRFEAMRRRARSQDGGHETIQALAWTAPHKRFLAASRARLAARAAWQEYFRTRDAFLMPAAFVPAFPHDHGRDVLKRVIPTAEGPREYFDLMYWAAFASLAGLPATVAPAGRTAGGLPVGIQILGPYLEDATPIDLAGRMADVIGGFTAPHG